MAWNQIKGFWRNTQIAVFGIMLLSATSVSSEENFIQHVTRICQTHPEEALALLDSAEVNHLLKPNDINGLRAVIYQNAYGQTYIALAYSKRIYENPEVQKDTVTLTKALKQLAALNYQNGNYGKTILYAQKGSALAHATNNWEAEAFFLQYVGLALADMYQIEEALTYIDRSIDLYQRIVPKAQTWHEADNLFYAWIQKANILFSARQYEQAIALFPQCEAALQQLAEAEGLAEGVLDIRTAQFCSLGMLCLINNQEPDKAKSYYDRFRMTATASDPSEVRLLIPYLIATQQYQTAMTYLQQARHHFEEIRDTIHSRYIDNILQAELQIQQATGKTAEAVRTANRIIALKDSLFAREYRQKAIEMAAIYETEDKAHQIERQNVKLQQGRIVILFAILLLTIACIVIAVIVRYNRLIRKKNRAAVATIHELMSSKSKLTERTSQPDPIELQPDETGSAKPSEGFQQLMCQIEEKQLFRNPNFSRNEALTLMPGISLKNFSLQFNKYAGCTFPRYLNNLRLEYSLGLLRSSANYSIEGIALESGFSCRQTYHRLFVERFGLTPVEYKNTEQEEQNQSIENQQEE